MNLDRSLIQVLESLQRAGISALPRPAQSPWHLAALVAGQPTIDVASEQVSVKSVPLPPVHENSVSVKPLADSPPVVSPAPKAASKLTERTLPPPPQTGTTLAATPSSSEHQFMNAPVLSRAERESCLSALSRKVATCKRCAELAATRKQTVFGVGNPEAEVMFIGEAPGADEDKQGEPFVGRAGQLLNRIIEACGWRREELYICNILRCRPPENRNPTSIEAANCREYLDGQIETVNPRYIVCLGTIAAQNLLGNQTPIGRLRGQLFTYGRAQVLCTYHPSYLLRNPSARSLVRDDLQILLSAMGLDPNRLIKQQRAADQ